MTSGGSRKTVARVADSYVHNAADAPRAPVERTGIT